MAARRVVTVPVLVMPVDNTLEDVLDRFGFMFLVIVAVFVGAVLPNLLRLPLAPHVEVLVVEVVLKGRLSVEYRY